MEEFIREIPWIHIFPFLKSFKGLHTRDEAAVCLFFEGVCIVLRSGMQWRFLPPQYGSWRAVHRRFLLWKRRGVWDSLLQHVLQNQCDETAVMIDSSIVRAHACAAGYKKNSPDEQALGRSKGGFTTKIHLVSDALGGVLRFRLTPGQRNDITQAPILLEATRNARVIADKGYDSNALLEQLRNQGCTPVIPPRKNRKNPQKYDEHVYKERHLIECFFGKIKHFRRVFSRFDKTADAYAAFICIASTIIWIR
jgi:transposase